MGQLDRSVIVLEVDRLSAWMLGPYGNTWFDTINFNRLAAQSMLMENAVADTPDLKLAYRSLWFDLHALGPNTGTLRMLPDKVADFHIPSILLTDQPANQLSMDAGRFDKIIEIERRSNSVRPSSNQSETQMGRFFAQAIDLITRQPEDCFCWLHCQGLSGNWDAPYGWRKRLADDEDPDPPDFTCPPSGWINEATDDPDVLLGYQQAAGAQVMLLDECLGVMLDELDRSPLGESALFCFLSTRGYPLGEHQVVGDHSPTLYAESLDVPLILRWPDRRHEAVRSRHLVTPRIVHGLALDWLTRKDSRVNFEEILPEKTRELICSVCEGSLALQTYAWKLIRSDQRRRLYVKPDDRWEVNDVSDRCSEIVAKMDSLLDNISAQFQSNEDEVIVNLDPQLVHGLE